MHVLFETPLCHFRLHLNTTRRHQPVGLIAIECVKGFCNDYFHAYPLLYFTPTTCPVIIIWAWKHRMIIFERWVKKAEVAYKIPKVIDGPDCCVLVCHIRSFCGYLGIWLSGLNLLRLDCFCSRIGYQRTPANLDSMQILPIS